MLISEKRSRQASQGRMAAAPRAPFFGAPTGAVAKAADAAAGA
jgi:hypothetical protein